METLVSPCTDDTNSETLDTLSLAVLVAGIACNCLVVAAILGSFFSSVFTQN